jgi:RNA polymerase sigma-70 factor, ECF subfamily
VRAGHSADVQKLVEAAKAGEPEAQGALFDRYYFPIYRYAYARLRRVADAEDAAAETLVSVFGGLPRFSWRGVPFEAWVFRIAASKVADIGRRRAAAPDPATLDSIVELPTSADETDPVVHAERSDERTILIGLIDELPRDQRDVLVLRFFLDRSIAETAAILGRSEGAVKQLQFRAIARIRDGFRR